MPRVRNPLKAIFSPTRRLVGVDPVVVQQGGPLGGSEWVVPRADCQYRRIDLSTLPPRQRHGAARIAARRDQLQPEAVSRIAWAGGIAHVWTCVPTGSAAAAIDAGAPWLPESLLRPRPEASGPCLQRMVRGVEGQLWLDGQLVASQWWPEVPGLDAWHRFLRAAGLSPADAAAVPEVLEARWGTPWAEPAFQSRVSPAAIERFAWQLIIAALVFAFAWQATAYQRWSSALARLDTRIQTLREQAAPLIEARERADVARQQLQSYDALLQDTNDFTLMAEVVRPLPEGTRLASWQREGATLQVGVRTTETDPRVFIAAFENHPQLSSVQAAPAEVGVMRLDFTLPGGAEPEPEA